MRIIANLQQRNSQRITANIKTSTIIVNSSELKHEYKFDDLYMNESFRIINEKEMCYLYPLLLEHKKAAVLWCNCQFSNIINKSVNFEQSTKYCIDMLKMLYKEFQLQDMYLKVTFLKFYNDKFYDLLLNTNDKFQEVSIHTIECQRNEDSIKFTNAIEKEVNDIKDIDEVEKHLYTNNSIYNRSLHTMCDLSQYIYIINIYKNENNIIHKYVLYFLICNYIPSPTDSIKENDQIHTNIPISELSLAFSNNPILDNKSSFSVLVSYLFPSILESLLGHIYIDDTSISDPTSSSIDYFATMFGLTKNQISLDNLKVQDTDVHCLNSLSYQETLSSSLPKEDHLSNTQDSSSINVLLHTPLQKSIDNKSFVSQSPLSGSLSLKFIPQDSISCTENSFVIPPPSPLCLSPIDLQPVQSSSDNEYGNNTFFSIPNLNSMNNSANNSNCSTPLSSASVSIPTNYSIHKKSIYSSHRNPFAYPRSLPISRSSSIDPRSSTPKELYDSISSILQHIQETNNNETNHKSKGQSTHESRSIQYKKYKLSDDSIEYINTIEKQMDNYKGYVNNVKVSSELNQAKDYIEKGIQCEKQKDYKDALNWLYKAQVLFPDDAYLIEYIYKLKQALLNA